jgi:hypothetical protein
MQINNRPLEIFVGVLLTILGLILMIPGVPLPGTPVLLAGIMFVSPQHGRRLIWWLVCTWKWFKAHFHRLWHGRIRVFKRKK